MKVVANRSLCSGHARCNAVAPEFYDLDDDGYIGFSEKDVPASLEAVARRGARACPERALSVVEDQPTLIDGAKRLAESVLKPGPSAAGPL